MPSKVNLEITRDISNAGFRPDQFLLCLRMSGPKYETLANNLSGGMKGTFLAICAANKVQLSELQDIWAKFNIVLGKTKMAAKVPAILDGISDQALSVETICSTCKGFGFIQDDDEEFPPCPKCEGLGKFIKPGDKDAQKLTLEVLGLIGKQPFITVGQVGNNFSFANLVSESYDIMKTPDIIDVSKVKDAVFLDV